MLVRSCRLFGAVQELFAGPTPVGRRTSVTFHTPPVFEKIGKIKPSWRNELEITDVNNMYLKEDTLTHSVLDGWWTDAGTFESLLRATNLAAQTGANKVPGRGAPERQAKDLD